MLRREQGLFPRMASSLTEKDLLTITEPADDVDVGVDPDQLEAAFHVRNTVASAAFVAGRVDAAGEIAKRLMAALRTVIGEADPHDLDVNGLGYIEACMALALRGQLEEGHVALRPVVDRDAMVTMGQWLAGYYLAQMGDPSGYPTVVRILGSDDGYTRLMAARHLIGFLPYDGQVIEGETVAVSDRLTEHLDDKDPYVSVEIPDLLAEADGEDLVPLLRRAAKKARHKETRRAAKAVLDRLAS